MPPCLKNHVVTKRLDRCSIIPLLLLHVARLPVPPPTPPHVHVAPGHPSPEEHVENFFCRHITLEKKIGCSVDFDPDCAGGEHLEPMAGIFIFIESSAMVATAR